MSTLTFENALRSSRAYSLIRGDLVAGLGHAYMVVSADDDVVDEFFTLVGESIYCPTHDACGECAECKKVAHNNHADVFISTPRAEKSRLTTLKPCWTQSPSSRSRTERYILFTAPIL